FLVGALPARAELPSLYELVTWRFPDAREVADQNPPQVRYLDPVHPDRLLARVVTRDAYSGDADLYTGSGARVLLFRTNFQYWPRYYYLDAAGKPVATVHLDLGEGGGEVTYYDGAGQPIDE